MKRIFTKTFDIEGNELSRVGRILLLSRIIPMGNFGSGPDVRCFITMIVLHYFSRPIFWLSVRREDDVRRLVAMVKKLNR